MPGPVAHPGAAGELASYMGRGTDWHIYSGPLVLAFAPDLRPRERAQILACHAAEEAREELGAFERGPGARQPAIGWIDSVREGALGYLAVCVHDDADAAAFHFTRACDRSNDWLRARGIPFGSTPHLALAACALHLRGRRLDACLAVAHEALHDAREHAVVVDEIAARRAAEALYRCGGDVLRAEHHGRRAAAVVRHHGLATWDRVLLHRLTRVDEGDA